MRSQPRPTTIGFDRQFDLPLVTRIVQSTLFTTRARGPGPTRQSDDTFAGPHVSGTYEVTALADGTWHIADLWLTLDNGRTGFYGRTVAHHVEAGTALFDALVELITAHHREA